MEPGGVAPQGCEMGRPTSPQPKLGPRKAKLGCEGDSFPDTYCLREKLGDSARSLSNRAASGRFQGDLYRALQRGTLPQLPQPSHGVHTLRATYVAYCWEMFDCGHFSLPRTGMQVLCHENMAEVLHYTAVRLKKTEGLPTLGDLCPFLFALGALLGGSLALLGGSWPQDGPGYPTSYTPKRTSWSS